MSQLSDITNKGLTKHMENVENGTNKKFLERVMFQTPADKEKFEHSLVLLGVYASEVLLLRQLMAKIIVATGTDEDNRTCTIDKETYDEAIRHLSIVAKVEMLDQLTSLFSNN